MGNYLPVTQSHYKRLTPVVGPGNWGSRKPKGVAIIGGTAGYLFYRFACIGAFHRRGVGGLIVASILLTFVRGINLRSTRMYAKESSVISGGKLSGRNRGSIARKVASEEPFKHLPALRYGKLIY